MSNLWTSRRAAKTESAHSPRSHLLNQLELLPPLREPERYCTKGSFIFLTHGQPTITTEAPGSTSRRRQSTTPLDLYPHCPSTPPSWCPIPVVNPDCQIIAASFTSIDFLRPPTWHPAIPSSLHSPVPFPSIRCQLPRTAINMSLANKLSIEDVDLKGKRVLIRVCTNM